MEAAPPNNSNEKSVQTRSRTMWVPEPLSDNMPTGLHYLNVTRKGGILPSVYHEGAAKRVQSKRMPLLDI
jgi:hypothetical protein